MPLELTKFDAAEYINTPERARAYLEMAIDEDPGDGSDVRAALNMIARAQNMSAIARAGRARPGRSDQDAIHERQPISGGRCSRSPARSDYN